MITVIGKICSKLAFVSAQELMRSNLKISREIDRSHFC